MKAARPWIYAATPGGFGWAALVFHGTTIGEIVGFAAAVSVLFCIKPAAVLVEKYIDWRISRLDKMLWNKEQEARQQIARVPCILLTVLWAPALMSLIDGLASRFF